MNAGEALERSVRRVARDAGVRAADFPGVRGRRPVARGDDSEPVSNLEKQGVSSEMHIYASGGHGFGIRPSARPVSQWTERLEQWMAERKLGGGASRGDPIAGRGLHGQLEQAWWCASPFQRGAEDV